MRCTCATGRTSIRQLSTNFSQFNNVQLIRSRKAPTRKEAAAVNQWRYSKLKEYNELNVEAGDEAFDRYIRNVRLLEEIFHVKCNGCDVLDTESGLVPEMRPSRPPPGGEMVEPRSEETSGDAEEQKRRCTVESNKVRELRHERYMALKEVNEKLSRVRSEEELRSCKKMRSEVFLGGGEVCSIPGKKKMLVRREIEQKTLDELEKCSTFPGLMEIQAL